jgi:hypothetical protein
LPAGLFLASWQAFVYHLERALGSEVLRCGEKIMAVAPETAIMALVL